MNTSVARYALGAASTLVLLGALGAGAVALRRRWLPGVQGALARLAEVVIGGAILIAILEILGAIGLFSLVPIVAAGVLVSAAVAWLARAPRRPAAPRTPWPPVGATGVIALLAAGAVIAAWASPTIEAYDTGIRSFDSLWYHLPWAASFAQTGHLTPLRFTDVEYLTAFYPASAEALHGLGIVLFGRDTVSPGVNLVVLALVLLAGWCVGRSRGKATASLVATAVAMATPMMIFSQPGGAANDVVGIFFLLAAVAFVLEPGPDRPALYVLAAVSAGLAVSIKLSLVAPVIALTLAMIVFAPTGTRRRSAPRWLIPLLVAGGFWYVRNLIAVGNPLPWSSFGGVLPTPAPPLQQDTGFAVVHYLTHSGVWSHFFQPGLAAGLGPWWYLIIAAAILGPLLCLVTGEDRTVRMLGAVALASLIGYILTPESAAGPAGDPKGFAENLRYAAPALTLCLSILPLAAAFRSQLRGLALLAALLALLLELVIQGSLYPTSRAAGAIVIAAAFVAFALVSTRASVRWTAVAAAAALIALAIAGYPLQGHYLRERYKFTPGVSDLARVWAFFRHVRHSRVALAGTFGGFFSYPLYGTDDSNRVQYVGRRGSHGSFAPITSCRQWRRAIDEGRYSYVVATPNRDPWQPKVLRPSPERVWTASDPAAHLVLGHRAFTQEISVFRLTGPLDPSACPA